MSKEAVHVVEARQMAHGGRIDLCAATGAHLSSSALEMQKTRDAGLSVALMTTLFLGGNEETKNNG